MDLIHEIYFRLATTGQGSAEDHGALTQLAHQLIGRHRLDAILLAGTDLSVIFNSSNTEFPYLDCAQVHIAAIMRRLLG